MKKNFQLSQECLEFALLRWTNQFKQEAKLINDHFFFYFFAS